MLFTSVFRSPARMLIGDRASAVAATVAIVALARPAMRCVFSEFMRVLLLSRQGGPDCRASRDVADSAGAAATMAIRSTNCASDSTPKPMGVIFPVKGWAR